MTERNYHNILVPSSSYIEFNCDIKSSNTEPIEPKESPLVIQRKLNMGDEWATLMNHQAAVANELLKKEKEKKELYKKDIK